MSQIRVSKILRILSLEESEGKYNKLKRNQRKQTGKITISGKVIKLEKGKHTTR